jgi:hypothetical protein
MLFEEAIASEEARSAFTKLDITSIRTCRVTVTVTGGYPEIVHMQEGLACRKRVASVSSPALHACGCARPSRACFGHKTVKADHVQRRFVVLWLPVGP